MYQQQQSVEEPEDAVGDESSQAVAQASGPAARGGQRKNRKSRLRDEDEQRNVRHFKCILFRWDRGISFSLIDVLVVVIISCSGRRVQTCKR